MEHSIGSRDAKVLVTEFLSLNCPHCARFAQQVLPEIKKNLIDTGWVRLILRDYRSAP